MISEINKNKTHAEENRTSKRSLKVVTIFSKDGNFGIPGRSFGRWERQSYDRPNIMQSQMPLTNRQLSNDMVSSKYAQKNRISR